MRNQRPTPTRITSAVSRAPTIRKRVGMMRRVVGLARRITTSPVRLLPADPSGFQGGNSPGLEVSWEGGGIP